MRLRWSLAVTAALLSLAALQVRSAQADNPWDRPGTHAGDEITGPDGGKMVWVSPGEFDMGQQGVATPVHHVRITRGFWLGKCDVTNAQYQKYCQDVGAEFPKGSDQGDNHPVVLVNWTEAVAYCKHYGLALPTEAQWEYAARGPEGRDYPWGDAWDEHKCCNDTNKGPKGKTFPVGSFPEGASWCGALDMAGEVLQWCRDYDVGYAKSPVDDPQGRDNNQFRMDRGGWWWGDAESCRSACRDGNPLMFRSPCLGFRCSRTPEAK